VEGKHSGAQQFDAGAAVHRSLERLEPIDLPLCLTVTPRFEDGVLNRSKVLAQRAGDLASTNERYFSVA